MIKGSWYLPSWRAIFMTAWTLHTLIAISIPMRSGRRCKTKSRYKRCPRAILLSALALPPALFAHLFRLLFLSSEFVTAPTNGSCVSSWQQQVFFHFFTRLGQTPGEYWVPWEHPAMQVQSSLSSAFVEHRNSCPTWVVLALCRWAPVVVVWLSTDSWAKMATVIVFKIKKSHFMILCIERKWCVTWNIAKKYEKNSTSIAWF